AEIDGHVAQIRLFPPADRAVGHKHEPSERRDFSHQAVAVDPRIDTLLERKIHARRTDFDVEQEERRVAKGFQERHKLYVHRPAAAAAFFDSTFLAFRAGATVTSLR